MIYQTDKDGKQISTSDINMMALPGAIIGADMFVKSSTDLENFFKIFFSPVSSSYQGQENSQIDMQSILNYSLKKNYGLYVFQDNDNGWKRVDFNNGISQATAIPLNKNKLYSNEVFNIKFQLILPPAAYLDVLNITGLKHIRIEIIGE